MNTIKNIKIIFETLATKYDLIFNQTHYLIFNQTRSMTGTSLFELLQPQNNRLLIMLRYEKQSGQLYSYDAMRGMSEIDLNDPNSISKIEEVIEALKQSDINTNTI